MAFICYSYVNSIYILLTQYFKNLANFIMDLFYHSTLFHCKMMQDVIQCASHLVLVLFSTEYLLFIYFFFVKKSYFILKESSFLILKILITLLDKKKKKRKSYAKVFFRLYIILFLLDKKNFLL